MNTTASRAAIQAAGWVKVEDVPEEWKDGREVLGAYGGPGNPSSWTEFLTCRDGHWHNRRYAMLRPQFIRLINPPGQPDPVAAHLEAALDREQVLLEALARALAHGVDCLEDITFPAASDLSDWLIAGMQGPLQEYHGDVAERVIKARALLESRHD